MLEEHREFSERAKLEFPAYFYPETEPQLSVGIEGFFIKWYIEQDELNNLQGLS